MAHGPDARINFTPELLGQLLQLPEGWVISRIGLHPDSENVLCAEVVFPDGPLGATAPIELTPAYRYVRTAEGRAVERTTIDLRGVPTPAVQQ